MALYRKKRHSTCRGSNPRLPVRCLNHMTRKTLEYQMVIFVHYKILKLFRRTLHIEEIEKKIGEIYVGNVANVLNI